MAKPFVLSLLPPLLVTTAKRWRGHGLRFSGTPPDWAAALTMSSGYGATEIAERVTKATREVVEGRAIYERDSILFSERDFRFPVVAALMHVAALNQGQLNVIDFGGALGSTYWQCRPFLDGLREVNWQVIEQASYVAIGQREFTSDRLSFSTAINQLPFPLRPSLVLASSVLQYIECPMRELESFKRPGISHLLIDRTPLHKGPSDHLTIQRVPKAIYPASYPCWIFSRSQLMAQLDRHWRLVSEFTCEEEPAKTDEGLPFEFRGLYLERK